MDTTTASICLSIFIKHFKKMIQLTRIPKSYNTPEKLATNKNTHYFFVIAQNRFIVTNSLNLYGSCASSIKFWC